jgi:Sec-independent protein secretion pathway component TatC
MMILIRTGTILIRIPALVWVAACVVALFLQDWRCVTLVLVFLPMTVLYELELEKRRQEISAPEV